MKKFKLFLTSIALMFVCVLGYAQNLTVKGVVSDANGEALPGVGVIIEGTAKGTTTNADGSYSISVPSDASLKFTSIGYKDQIVPVNGQSVINVTLADDAEMLDETIVVAFGTSTKEAFTGSAKVIDDKELVKSQVSAITNALAGKVAGVQLMSSNGAPGATASINVRGLSSISAGTSPLIVVDGAPFGGDMNNINPNDIESMTVLKDAASNALYGARGANGVIMITTKKAKQGDALVTVDMKVGVNSKGLKEYKTINTPAGYYEQHYEALKNYWLAQGLSANDAYVYANTYLTGSSSSGGLGYNVYTVPEGQYLIGSNGKLNPNATLGNYVTYKGEDYLVTPDDWNEYAYRKGLRQEYNVSVAARHNKGSFYASVGYLDNEGITNASDMKRLTGRLKADYQAKKWLTVGANVALAHFDYNSLGNNGSSSSTGNIWAFTSQLAPIYPLYIRNADGSIKIDANGFEMMDYGSGLNAGYSRSYLGDSNALMDSYLNTRNSEGNSFDAHGYVDIAILPELKLTINGSSYLDETRYKYVYNPYYGQFDSTGGTVSVEHDRYITYNLQQILNYNKKFGDHNVGLMLGHEYYDAKSYALYGSKHMMFDQKNTELNGAVIDDKGAGSYLSEYNNEGYFFRGLYDYASKYYFSASIRRDASSRFAPAHRWGTFWSLGGAWIISKEPWFQVPYVDELKFKVSLGSQGNDNIGSYRYTNLYNIFNGNGQVATSFSSKGNEEITWETNRNFNVGFEFGLFQRLSGSIDFFNRKTIDMLFSFPVAPSMGYSSYYANVGDMSNKGIEIDLGANIINNKNFRWDVNANLTWIKNKIIMLDDEKKTKTAYDMNGKAHEGYQSGSIFVAEGISYYSWYIKEYAGVDQETGESLWYKIKYKMNDDGQYLDQNGAILKDQNDSEAYVFDGVETTNSYSDADYFINNKTGMAPVYGGFGTSLEAFGFDFSVNFSYQIGGWRYDSQYASFMASPASSNIGYNYHVDLYKSWTAENPSSDIPRFQYGDTYSAATSSRFLTKASYLNIENINLGYTIPSKYTSQIGLSSVRVYIAAENLGYWSMRRGFDPRQGYLSADASSYSPMKTVSGGITVKF